MDTGARLNGWVVISMDFVVLWSLMTNGTKLCYDFVTYMHTPTGSYMPLKIGFKRNMKWNETLDDFDEFDDILSSMNDDKKEYRTWS